MDYESFQLKCIVFLLTDVEILYEYIIYNVVF